MLFSHISLSSLAAFNHCFVSIPQLVLWTIIWKFSRVSRNWLFIWSVDTSEILTSVGCAASFWGSPICFRSCSLSCFFFCCVFSVLSYSHTRSQTHTHTHTHTPSALPPRLRQETGGSGIRVPRLFWNLEMEATSWYGKQQRWSRNKLVSAIAKGWASLLTVTLTSVLHRTKQIRLSAVAIRLIRSQRQECLRTFTVRSRLSAPQIKDQKKKGLYGADTLCM